MSSVPTVHGCGEASLRSVPGVFDFAMAMAVGDLTAAKPPQGHNNVGKGAGASLLLLLPGNSPCWHFFGAAQPSALKHREALAGRQGNRNGTFVALIADLPDCCDAVRSPSSVALSPPESLTDGPLRLAPAALLIVLLLLLLLLPPRCVPGLLLRRGVSKPKRRLGARRPMADVHPKGVADSPLEKQNISRSGSEKETRAAGPPAESASLAPSCGPISSRSGNAEAVPPQSWPMTSKTGVGSLRPFTFTKSSLRQKSLAPEVSARCVTPEQITPTP
mmetsp:Transcript_96264/g.206620  ORF Transcript_96264/g.206620 Transcript_96264/m.206620 type:complete len:276 (+) Transcript_96264:298-1125(+)